LALLHWRQIIAGSGRSFQSTGAPEVPYERRMGGQTVQTFDTEEETVAHAREAMQKRPESEPEVFDATTGKLAAPGASKADRDDLAANVGF
jgi:hypothetical protein